jgi:hypothetical protein
MGLIVTFTVPKVIHEMGEAQKKAVGKETITALHDALYAGWQDGTLNSSTTYQQLGDYLASKLNITRDCPVGRAAGDCVTSFPGGGHFDNTKRILVLANGAWVSLYWVNWGSWPNFCFFIDYNGATGPNIGPEDPPFGNGTPLSSDTVCLWFNQTQQKVTAAPIRHGDNYQAGALVTDRDYNRHLVYNYWMGLD